MANSMAASSINGLAGPFEFQITVQKMDIFAGFSVTAVILFHLNLIKEAGDLELSLIEQPKPFFPTFTVVPERITSKPLRILIFLDYNANKSFYNNKNLDILPILAYIH